MAPRAGGAAAAGAAGTTPVARVFNEAKRSMAGHRKYVGMLAARRAATEGGAAAFTEELVESLKFVLVIGARDPGAERVVRLCGALAARREAGEEEDADDFAETFLAFLVSVAAAKDKAVRFRAAQLISQVMNSLDEEAELSDELYDDVREAMLGRLRDRHPPVRAQAVRALARLQEPGDSGDFSEDDVTTEFRRLLRTDKNKDVRKAVLASIAVADSTLGAVVERVRDVADDVRRMAFMVLASKATPRALSIAQRAAVLRHGLGDRAPATRKAAAELLKTTWLADHCSGDVLKLLAMLDVETHTDVAATVVTELYESGVIDVNAVADASKAEGGLAAACAAVANGELAEGAAPITPEAALYWRVVTLALHNGGHERGSDAARAGGGGGVQAVAAAAAERLLEALEGVMPSATADIFGCARACASAGARSQAAQLLALTPAADVSDATCMRAGAELVRDMLACEPPAAGGPAGELRCSEEQRTLDLAVAGAAKHLGGGAEQCAMIVNAVEALSSAHGFYPEAEEDADAIADIPAWVWLRCAWLVELAASCMSPNSMRSLPPQLASAVSRFAATAAARDEPLCRAAGARALGAALVLGVTDAWASHAPALLAAQRDESRCVRAAAARPLMDMCLLFQPATLDRLLAQASEADADAALPECRRALLEELAAGLASSIEDEEGDEDDLPAGDAVGHAGELQAVTAEGFAKLLLWGRIPQELSPHKVLGGLVLLYFDAGTAELPRLRQCLAVFFDAFARASAGHADVAADAFLPAVRAAAAGGSRHATQVARFAASIVRADAGADGEGTTNASGARLALALAREVACVPATAATKAHRQQCARALSAAAATTTPGVALPAGLAAALEAAAGAVGADKIIAKEVAAAQAALAKAFEGDATASEGAQDDHEADMAAHAEEALESLEAAIGNLDGTKPSTSTRSSRSSSGSGRGGAGGKGKAKARQPWEESESEESESDSEVESEGEDEGEIVESDEEVVDVDENEPTPAEPSPAPARRATRGSKGRATRAALAENQVA